MATESTDSLLNDQVTHPNHFFPDTDDDNTIREVQNKASEEAATVLQYEIAMYMVQEAGMDISNVTPQELIHLFVNQQTGVETSEETCEQSHEEIGEMETPDTAPPPSAETTKGVTLTDKVLYSSVLTKSPCKCTSTVSSCEM